MDIEDIGNTYKKLYTESYKKCQRFLELVSAYKYLKK